LIDLDAGNKRRNIEALLKRTKASTEVAELVNRLMDERAEMKLELHNVEQARALDPRKVRSAIFGLAEQTPAPPDWLIREGGKSKGPGIPTLFASDWHWSEVVNGSEINNVNNYNLKIAHQRARLLFERTIDLAFNHMVSPHYDGIVLALGGDMVSGDIHDELAETNELPSLPAVLDLSGALIQGIEILRDKFGKVFVPCVAGNHGRLSRKPRAKYRAHTNYDWLTYQIVERHFKGDKRAQFHIPDGADASYRVYGHRYLLSHGDQFRGGDGQVGALGPILRGDLRKRTRNGQVDLGYDTLLLGHWHQYTHMGRVIVNGSLKGYDEYASQSNFGFEVAQQALWFTHPKHGITMACPVIVQEHPYKKVSREWVSIPK